MKMVNPKQIGLILTERTEEAFRNFLFCDKRKSRASGAEYLIEYALEHLGYLKKAELILTQ